MTLTSKRARGVWVLAFLAGALGTGRASAEVSDEQEEASPKESAPPAKSAKKHKKKPKQAPEDPGAKPVFPWLVHESKDSGKLEVHGRLFARAAFSRHYVVAAEPSGALHEEHIDSLDLSIPSARAELFYRAPFRWLSADLEFEFAGKPELKDAWLRAKNKHFSAKFGQYKPPFSAIELESIWSLPMASRGLLHDILVDELQVAGRRPGLTLGARSAGAIDLSLTLGAFQGSVLVDDDPGQRDVDLLSEQSLRSQSLFLRVELGFDDVTFGLSYESRVGTPALLEIEHYPTFGADAVLDTRLLGRGLRVWAEGMTGASWLEHARKPTDDRNAVFSAGRLVVAPRIGGGAKRAPYFEPYGMLGLFDPDTEVAQDLAFEESLGMNAGFWRLARLGLELQISQVERNFPAAYGFGKKPDRLAVLLQAGAEF